MSYALKFFLRVFIIFCFKVPLFLYGSRIYQIMKPYTYKEI